jgi:hypothetical protein
VGGERSGCSEGGRYYCGIGRPVNRGWEQGVRDAPLRDWRCEDGNSHQQSMAWGTPAVLLARSR